MWKRTIDICQGSAQYRVQKAELPFEIGIWHAAMREICILKCITKAHGGPKWRRTNKSIQLGFIVSQGPSCGVYKSEMRVNFQTGEFAYHLFRSSVYRRNKPAQLQYIAKLDIFELYNIPIKYNRRTKLNTLTEELSTY